jgi:hypothetical protein
MIYAHGPRLPFGENSDNAFIINPSVKDCNSFWDRGLDRKEEMWYIYHAKIKIHHIYKKEEQV